MTPLLVAIALAPKPSGPVYHVAPNGSDANPGSVSRPFATIERARDAVRKQAAARSAHRPVTVLLRGGIHRLRATLGFGKADSGRSGAPVTFRAYPGERPVVTGAISVTGFRRGPGRELVAELAQDARLQVATFEGRRLEQARYPNRDREDAHGGRWAYVDGKRYSMYADSPGPPSDPEDAKRDFWQRNRPELTRSLRMRPDDARRIGDASGGQVSVGPGLGLPAVQLVALPAADRGG
ncbi:MAG: hypothetical protein FJX72_06215 [Armatimonadetes bacterium]|nr:hypothetical protein [Armatimonadota bacterium]